MSRGKEGKEGQQWCYLIVLMEVEGGEEERGGAEGKTEITGRIEGI